MKKKVKIGVLGAGKMGKNHIRIISELGERFDFIGIYDSDDSKKEIAELYGVKFFSDYDSMLKEIDAVIIASPTSTHKEAAIKAAYNGVHALVEKPISENIDDTKEICTLFNKNNLKLMVGYIERFNPVVKAISEIVKDINLVAIEIHRCSPFDGRIDDADVVLDMMIHDIDILTNSIMCSDPKNVFSIGKKIFTSKYVDYAHSVFSFDNAVLGFVTSSRSTESKIRTIEIHSKEVYIEGDMLNKTLSLRKNTSYLERPEFPAIKYSQSNITENIILPITEPLKEELLAFWRYITGESESYTSNKQIVRSMDVLSRIRSQIYNREEL